MVRSLVHEHSPAPLTAFGCLVGKGNSSAWTRQVPHLALTYCTLMINNVSRRAQAEAQIAHLRRLLSDLGMRGQPTKGKAKVIKEKREMAAELGTFPPPPPTRSLIA